MIGRKLDLVWTFHGMYRWFSVVPQALIVFLPFSLFGDFWAFSWFFRGEVLEVFLWGILVGCHVWGPCASLLGDLDPTNPPKRLRFGGFRWFLEGCVLPDCPGKTDLIGFPNRSDLFSPVGCREEFLSKKVSVVLWLFLFRGGEVLEAGFLLEGFLGSSGQNRPDRFAKPVWLFSPACWKAKSHKSDLTGFWNRPDRFFSGSRCSSCFPLRVVEWLSAGSCSGPVAL
jgi:hypothetical protein